MNPTLWLTKGSRFLRARAGWAALFVLASLVLCILAPSPPAGTTEGVATLLGDAAGGKVRPEDFVWEARRGSVSEALFGRHVLFLARREGATQADLFRARVRLTRGGRPISISGVHNLAKTPQAMTAT